MASVVPLVATCLACACGVLAAVQGVLPGRRRWGRRARAVLQVAVSAVQIAALVLVVNASATPSDARVYVLLGASFLGAFAVLDLGREAAYYVRAAYSDAPLTTAPATLLAALLAALHISLCAALIALREAQRPLSYCGHAQYIVRDIAPIFGGAVYALWALYEHAGAFICIPWCSAAACSSENPLDDGERALFTSNRVAAAVGAEAALEVLQTIMVVCTAVFSAALAEIIAQRRETCNGIWNASRFAVPLLAVGSCTLAGRFVSSQTREVVLRRSNM